MGSKTRDRELMAIGQKKAEWKATGRNGNKTEMANGIGSKAEEVNGMLGSRARDAWRNKQL